MPLYLCGRESTSTTDPTGRSSGSAATTPVCAATPEVVTRPLQYAVALKASRDPGSGSASVSCSVAKRATYFESSAVTSYIETKAQAAMPVTVVRRQKRLEMIIGGSFLVMDDVMDAAPT